MNSKLTMKILERQRQRQRHMFHTFGVSIVNFEHAIVGWVYTNHRKNR